MAEKTYTWYIKPLNTFTNTVIAGILPAENFSEEHKYWRCRSYDDISYLKNSRNDIPVRFKIFSQVGKGQIRDCSFFLKGKRPKFNKTP